MTTKLPENHKWLFVLLNKNTGLAGWWLKIRNLEELAAYLEQTNSRYARAFDNFLHDSFYQPSVLGHGKYIKEANLTLAAYLYGANRRMSMVESLTELASGQASRMADMLNEHGAIYVNSRGGWNYGGAFAVYDGDFCHKEKLTWPQMDETAIHITQFPGGQHYYAYIGNVQVRDGERLKFDTYESAMEHAKAYITTV